MKVLENASTTEVTDLQSLCTSLETHTRTLIEEKNALVEELKEISNVNNDLKRKFSSLLDSFQEYVTQ